MELTDQHLEELHRRARELEVPRYRLLTRDELIRVIQDSPGKAERSPGRVERSPKETEVPAVAAEGENGAVGEETGDGEEAVPPGIVTGVLERMPQGYGFLRITGMSEGEGDVYVSASQIRRCELKPGDEVSGPARAPRRGERHRALVRIETVNGQSPDEGRPDAGRSDFDELTPALPHRRLLPPDSAADPLVRAADLLGPLAFGQRVLVLAQPRSGRTTLLQAIASSLAPTDAHLCVILVDERPEEVTRWKRALEDAEIFAAPADQEPREQVRSAELAIGHAKRLAAGGQDVVVLIDSLSRLALGYRDPARVKRLFGAGRVLEEEGSGSLTVIATVLDADDRGADVTDDLLTTENVLLRLDAGLAAKRIVPAIDIAGSRSSGEDELREPAELERARGLREELSAMEPEAGARALAEQIERTANNAELLAPTARRRTESKVSEGARLLATQMAVAGSTRDEITQRLSDEFGIHDSTAILDQIGL